MLGAGADVDPEPLLEAGLDVEPEPEVDAPDGLKKNAIVSSRCRK